MPRTLSLQASGLQKRYGDTPALDGFDLEVEAGSIHGLLGPNGAGKSTAVAALCTLIELDGGTATVGGFDVQRDGRRVRERIGLVGQQSALDEVLGGRQNLVLFGRLSGLAKRDAERRADELLARFGLAEAADRAVSGYSGGMRRRLDIATSLIRTPAVLFLDEPTTGLDPRARGEVWRAVRDIAESGTTVLLTTQYLDEADRLAGRISVMDHGRIIAEGTPAELKRRVGGARIVVQLAEAASLARAEAAFGALGAAETGDAGVEAAASHDAAAPASVDRDAHRITLPAPRGAADLVDAVRTLDGAGIEVDDLELRRPTLDDVFLTLTEAAR